MQHIRTLLLVVVFISAFSGAKAANPPPLNDTVCDATDLGVLPIPQPCPNYPYGDTLVVNGTTDWASYNTFDFSPVHCFPSGAPDVWYRFRGTGSFLYVEMTGSGDLDSFFVKLFYGQGSCLDLVPMHCEYTYTGTMQVSFQTPNVGGEYYLQIGGSRYDETGNFSFIIKSYNECNSCVKNASIELSPAPWFGRYGTSDTVKMCVTVDRWDLTSTSYLHAIVPVFGDEWDTSSIVPLQVPGNAGSGWMWGQNVPTPLGSFDGVYFDSDFNGDPTDNAGDNGNITTSWTACWSISTKPYCNTYDASVAINILSDDISGNGNGLSLCQEAWPVYLNMAGWCCPDPIVSIVNGVGCAPGSIITVDPVSSSSTDTFNVVLYDDSMHVAGYNPNVTTTTGFVNVAPGDYLIEVYNVNTQCISFHQVQIDDVFEIDFDQTAIGCGPNMGQVVATPVGGLGPFTYSWPSITTFNDSLAFSLNEGYVTVIVTDAAGCSVTDSFYVTQLPGANAYFDYSDASYCSNDDTMQVYFHPVTIGGVYQLVSPPAASGITVSASDGTISLNGTSWPTPFDVVVKYTAGQASCTATYADSVRIVQQPAIPVASSPVAVDWCIGAQAPTMSINIASGFPFWYDVQTTQTGFGYTFTPSGLTGSSPPGQYLYGFIYLADLTGGCSSLPAVFTVNAHSYPAFTMGPDPMICPDDTANLVVAGSAAYTYLWTPTPTAGPDNAASTFTAPGVTTTYTCVVTDGTCSLQNTVTVTVDNSVDCGTTLYTGITPNNDGHNDVWIIDGAETATNMTVCIYNRWGQMVWKGNNYDNSLIVFRGRNGGDEELPSGTYFYTIEQDNRDPARGWLEISR